MITLKAVRMLNFIRRNFRQGSCKIKETLYFTFIRPVLNPHHNTPIEKLEQIQNQCARFVLNDYQRGASVTTMKYNLKWESLVERRKMFRLKLLHDIYSSHLLISREMFLQEPFYVSGRADHQNKIRPYFCRTDVFAFSFFPKTIEEWNRLAIEGCV